MITGPVTSALRPLTEGVQKAIELAKYPSIQAAEEDESLDTSMVILGPVAEKYLGQFASKEKVDKTFGLYVKDGEFSTNSSRSEKMSTNCSGICMSCQHVHNRSRAYTVSHSASNPLPVIM